ncbi:tetratricopeptide repeat protein [Pelagibacterales bacterium SAG-MED46]|nr:tetratricopeptide repeat protein [Pelagibacterales bacterium SAG-MED46]
MKLNNNQLLANAIKAHQEGNLDEAEKLYQQILRTEPKQVDANHNLGLILSSKNKTKEALVLFKIATEINPEIEQFWVSYISIFIKENKLDEAEKISRETLNLKPNFFKVHFYLGLILNNLKRLEEAKESYKKAIELKPDYAEAYFNLANVLMDYNKLQEAEVNYKKAIELKKDFAECYNGMGKLLAKLDKLEEAEIKYKKAIELKPNYSEAFNNLATVLQNNAKLEEAEEIYKKALELKPDFIEAQENFKTLLKFKKLSLKIKEEKKKYKNKLHVDTGLSSNLFISDRTVEAELIKSLYEIRTKDLNQTKGVFFGNGKHSLNFNLFEEVSKKKYSIIKKVEEDLTVIMKKAVKSEIFIIDSFFNILNNGGGSNFHTHLSKFDKINKLVKQKYSLTYYLTIGDQNCSKPGILKLKNPDKEILPSKGMIMIFQADRSHSAIYNGKEDRIMIGVNFYSLI